MDKSILELEEEVRRQLREVRSGSRALAVSGLDDAVKWVELKRATDDIKLTVIYIKGIKITVHAQVDESGNVTITSASLDQMPCWGSL
jgi:hypothetical protein